MVAGHVGSVVLPQSRRLSIVVCTRNPLLGPATDSFNLHTYWDIP